MIRFASPIYEVGENMAWKVGNVQMTQAMNFPAQPGFNLQQDGHSPSLTLIFSDEKTAKDARKMMQEIVDKAAAIFPAPR
jgi:hypothetical protein